MCATCEHYKQQIDHANGHIASLLDAIKSGSGADYEYSGPYLVGGTNGVYTVVSPFLYSSEWKVDIASAGASASQILISSSTKNASSVPDMTGASGVTYSGYSPLDGLLINLSPNGVVAVDSEWYDVRNTENILFVVISNLANAAYVNIQFRQKRK